MREIKFRAWDKKGQVGMIDNPKLDVVLGDSRYVIMQFTELKDKNNKEIYEGDIIKFKSEQNVFIEIEYSNKNKSKPPEIMKSVVKFNAGIFYFDGQYGYEGLEIRFSKVEIIGNIYENPELLEVKK